MEFRIIEFCDLKRVLKQPILKLLPNNLPT